ncbi:amidohydrolase family protein [Saccharopolyspora hattusasensis]|uniref:amidohydrolase family protein n=1 Tax=Saccharopolyspora hattusasensis TaxID=1128679 RepID=UPI003D963C98
MLSRVPGLRSSWRACPSAAGFRRGRAVRFRAPTGGVFCLDAERVRDGIDVANAEVDQRVGPDQALSAGQVLAGYTTEAADGAGGEQVAARIRVGVRADLAVVDGDPLTCAPDDCQTSRA